MIIEIEKNAKETKEEKEIRLWKEQFKPEFIKYQIEIEKDLGMIGHIIEYDHIEELNDSQIKVHFLIYYKPLKFIRQFSINEGVFNTAMRKKRYAYGEIINQEMESIDELTEYIKISVLKPTNQIIKFFNK